MKAKRRSEIDELKQQGLFDREIAERLGIAVSTVRSSKAGSIANRHCGPLTSRERQIAEMVAGEMKTADIAEKLHLSERTVSAHRYRISQKLGTYDPAEIATLLGKN